MQVPTEGGPPAPIHELPVPESSADSWVVSARAGPPAFSPRTPVPESFWAERPAAKFPACGDDFLGFCLVAELGRGAFGRVYLARQDDLARRLVALKVSTEIQTESHNLAQLQHTHIVPVYSVHRAGALHAVCMPYFGSATLADVLRDLQKRQTPPASGKGLVSTIQDRVSRTRASLDKSSRSGSGPLAVVAPSARLAGEVQATRVLDPPARKPAAEVPPTLRLLEGFTYVEAVLWLGERLADGLAHAHERGILHRDLKPANILLTDDGQPMLLDFNLSADTKADLSRARVGGTLPYMAPEHLAAFAGLPAPGSAAPDTPAVADARSDVYSLGVILYELLTGRAPFAQPGGNPGELLPAMIRSRLGPLPRVRPFNRSVTPAVESILQHCLEPNPARRYQSARQLLEDLERQRTHRPLAHARERSLRERASKWLRRNRRRAILGAGLLAMLLILGLVAGLASRGRRLARLEAVTTLAAFHDDHQEAHLLLAARPEEVSQRREGLRLATRALARYGLPGRAAWREQPAVQHLSSEEREQLVGAVGELLLLAAGVDEEGRGELLERAGDCFGADQAPRALAVRRAELARRRGDRDGARAWRQAAQRCPIRSATDHYLLARERVEAGRYVPALAHLREAVRLEPKYFAAWYLLGNCHLDGAEGAGMGETEAIRCFTACIALRPKFHGSYHNRGLAYFRQRHYARAEADFTAALGLRPKLGVGYLHRGLAREGQGKLPAALADLSRAIDLGGVPNQVYFARARVRRLLGDAGAERDEKEGLRRPPRDEESYILRGVLRAPGDARAALADFREAVQLNPRSLAGLYNQAFILSERLGQTQEAIGLLGEAVRRYPNLPAPRASRGVLAARLGRRDEALDDAREAGRLAGTSAEVLYQVACIHAQTSRSHPEDRHVAFRLLGQALRLGFGHDRLETEPDLKPLHPDPRFRKLVAAAQALTGK
jgi:serine/threonine protein kinase/predicted Zn-dependent protease